MKDQFHTFVESLRNDDNGELIGTIMEGYNAITLTESFADALPKPDYNRPDLKVVVDKLDNAFNKVVGIMEQMRDEQRVMILDRVAQAIKESLADRSYDAEFAGILKDNLQKMESKLSSNPMLTSDKIEYIADSFAMLYRRLFEVADAYGYAQ